MTTATAISAGNGSFLHEAMLYRDADDYLNGTVAFIRGGIEAGEPVLVAVPGPNLRLIDAALGPARDGVRLTDMAEAGRNPGRIIPGVLRAFVDAHPHGRVRIIGEPIWAGRSDVAYPACVQHEAPGRVPPAPNSEGGRGLLLVNHLCDLVRCHTDRGGTTVRMHVGR